MEYLELVNGKYVIKSNYVDDYKKYQAEEKTAKTNADKIKNGFLKEAKQISELDFGGFKLTKSADTIKLDFDLERFKEENPDLYRKYTKLVFKKGSTRLLVAKESK